MRFLFVVMTIILFTQLVQGKNCTCVEGDICCCPDGWRCCNYPGRCCCQSPQGYLYESHAHRSTPLQTTQEKLTERKKQVSMHCNSDCFFGQLCGDFCTCIWPNCVEKQQTQEIKNTYQCKGLMADCQSPQECCSNYCGAFGWCATGPGPSNASQPEKILD